MRLIMKLSLSSFFRPAVLSVLMKLFYCLPNINNLLKINYSNIKKNVSSY